MLKIQPTQQTSSQPQFSNNNNAKLVISTDTLGIYKSPNNIDFLIKGQDNDAFLMEMEVELSLHLIQQCYNCLEDNSGVDIISQGKLIVTFNNKF